MKQIFKHYVDISGKSLRDIAKEINDSGRWVKDKEVTEEVLRHWVNRSTPVFVEFDHRNYRIKGLINEKVLMGVKS